MEYKKAKDLFEDINIDLDEKEYEQLSEYENILLEWNNKINLTTITDDEEIFIKHFLDSCTICKYIKDDSRVIDVGTGAGFPTVPAKIINNTIKLTLLDSLNKRINFLKTLCEKLKLDNVSFVHNRAEDLAQEEEYREIFDVATARAVANLSTLSEYCLPFVKIGGIFICMKADNCDVEIEEAKIAISKLGGKIREISSFVLNNNINRTIIIIEKIKNTPKNYPRKAGMPAKSPIK